MMRPTDGSGGSADRKKQYTHDLPYTVKVITVAPGGTLSRPGPAPPTARRSGGLGTRVEFDEEVLSPEPGDELYIPREMGHRLSAEGKEPVRILEISFGEFEEEDIVRLEDVYGRAVQ